MDGAGVTEECRLPVPRMLVSESAFFGDTAGAFIAVGIAYP